MSDFIVLYEECLRFDENPLELYEIVYNSHTLSVRCDLKIYMYIIHRRDAFVVATAYCNCIFVHILVHGVTPLLGFALVQFDV